jgi:glutaredoxin
VSRPVVVVYTREHCGLCREAEAVVAREARGAEVRHVDVDTDDELQRRYGIRVPVVAVDGVEVAEVEVAKGEVRRAVRQAAKARRTHSARRRRAFRRGGPAT